MIKTKTTVNDELMEVLISYEVNSAERKKSIGRTIAFGLIIAVIWAAMAVTSCSVFDGVIAAVFLVFALSIKKIRQNQIRNVYYNGYKAMMNSTLEYAIDDEHIRIISEYSEAAYKWTAAYSYSETGHFLLIKLKTNMNVFIDKNSLSPAESDELQALLIRHNVTKE